MKFTIAVLSLAVTAVFAIPAFWQSENPVHDPIVGGVTPSESQILSELESEQEAQKRETGRYEFKREVRGEWSIERHEYVTPDGVQGYQIIMERDGVIHSYGYGPEADERTYELTKPNEETATTTR